MTALASKTYVTDPTNNANAEAALLAMWDVLNEIAEKAELDIASASTCDIGSMASAKLRITGTATITSLGTVYRGPILIRMAGALTITHNATTLVCPGSANITTAAGDVLMAWPKATTSGTADGWQVVRLVNGSGALPIVDGGTGARSASAARTALGLGTIATQAASSVAITGGSVTGIADLAIADGGTGASTAAAAFAALKQAATAGATGVARYGTDAEQLAGLLADVFCTPAGLGSGTLVGVHGYLKFPKGYVFQISEVAGPGDVVGTVDIAAIFPITFTTIYHVFPVIYTADAGSARHIYVVCTSQSTTQANFRVIETASVTQTTWYVKYIAVGKIV